MSAYRRYRWSIASITLAAIFLLLVFALLKIPAPAQAALVEKESHSYPKQEKLDLLSTTLYTVNTTIDENDGECIIDCSLRDAILLANTAIKPVEIRFNIPGCPFCTITPLNALPTISGGSITINGYSQPGSSPATGSTAADLAIELNGTNVDLNGLNVTSANNVIKGLVINRFDLAGISLWGTSAHHNLIAGNYIGLHPQGTSAQANGGGVVIGSGAHDNTVGGSTPADRNVISGNASNGVIMDGSNTSNNTVSGNYIGSNKFGEGDLPNNWVGVSIGNGAHDNTVGGDAAGEGNLISGNGWDGVYINGSATVSNTVSGNLIGVRANGINMLPNQWHGVRIDGGAKYNRIGGPTAAERNTIAANNRDGVRIAGNQTQNNTIMGNYIGLASDGVGPASNYWYGVTITDGARYNLVGGDASGEGNVISGNEDGGVQIFGKQTAYNQVSGNIIGLHPDGLTFDGNAGHGVYLWQGAHHNIVGGNRSGVCGGECNVISGNFDDGVRIDGNGTMSNTVSGNLIGTNLLGTTNLDNSGNGVTIRNGAQFNQIGGSLASQCNIISGQIYDYGISIEDSGSISGTKHNRVLGNYIGLDVTGLNGLPNLTGIVIKDGASDNQIGGSRAGEGNVISANSGDGIHIFGTNTTGNQIAGNWIGTSSDGLTELGNAYEGVYVTDGAQSNTIGPHNLIAYNQDGVFMDDEATQQIYITQNSIFANNSWGINLVSNANGHIQRPVINDVADGSVVVTGIACPNCLVELFSNPDTDGEGRHYQGSNTADMSGNFTITGYLLWPYLTATATDPISGTSKFSLVYEADNRQLFLPVVFR